MTSKLEDFRVTNISSFEYEPLIVDPIIVANAEQDMIDIMKRPGSSNRRANMTFYVKRSVVDKT